MRSLHSAPAVTWCLSSVSVPICVEFRSAQVSTAPLAKELPGKPKCWVVDVFLKGSLLPDLVPFSVINGVWICADYAPISLRWRLFSGALSCLLAFLYYFLKDFNSLLIFWILSESSSRCKSALSPEVMVVMVSNLPSTSPFAFTSGTMCTSSKDSHLMGWFAERTACTIWRIWVLLNYLLITDVDKYIFKKEVTELVFGAAYDVSSCLQCLCFGVAMCFSVLLLGNKEHAGDLAFSQLKWLDGLGRTS